MTAESCKDVIPKVRVKVAFTGEEALEQIQKESFDFIIVDFDLPDCDGVSFIKELKKSLSIPMFLTAFPDSLVLEAIQKELFWYKDASRLIPKPVNFKKLKKIIEGFVFKEEGLLKVFKPPFLTSLSAKKNKKPVSDMPAKILKMTKESVSVKYSKSMVFKKNEEITVKLYPSEEETKIPPSKGFFVRSTVFLADAKKKELNLVFGKLSFVAQKRIESILKKAKVLES